MTEPIAIIGMGAILPDALDVPTAWENFLAGHSAIGPVPEELWDLNVGLDETRQNIQTSYSKVAAAIRGFQFRPADFGLPPVVAKSMDPVQKATLVAAREALQGAGIHGPTDGIDAAVILGNLQGGSQTRGECWFKTSHKTLELTLQNLPAFKLLPAAAQEGFLQELRAAWFDQFLTNNSDALPGLLGNVAASRISHHYNFHGPAMVIDAACASSLAALEQAVSGLQANRFDLAVSGGADLQMDLPSYAGFCAMGALSPDGSRPFDVGANGFVMGEGAVVFVLKRLSDARRDGDRVYASICGIGSSSDGRGRSIVAPNPAGQVRAMRKAYAAAKVEPTKVGYLEAHGTATPLGDPTELEAVREIFGELPVGALPMGSAKGNMGHLKGAAGGAGLLRAALALYNQTVPPQAGFTTPNPHCDFEHSPVRVPTQAEPFVGDERYAAVSAFGFGGINYHVVLRSGDVAPAAHTRTSLPLGLSIVALGADTRAELIERLQQELATFTTAEALAKRTVASADPASYPVRVSFFAANDDDARKKLELAVSTLTKGGSAVRLEAAGILLRENEPTFGSDQVVFMSPGQGSQYVGMLDELKERFPVVAQTLAEADEIMAPVLGAKLSEFISPPAGKDANDAFMDLLRTEVLQPAMLTCDEALRRLLAPLVTPKAVLGHSLGEYGALIAAGVIDFADALRIVAARGEAMEEVALDDNGMMLAVGSDVATVEKLIEGIEGYIAVVNKNCPSQTILGGSTPAIQAAQEKLQAQGLECMFLPVSHAFHSEIVAPASAPLRRALDRIEVRAPRVPLLSNVTGGFYPQNDTPDTHEWIRATLAKQVAAPVEFITEIETAYAAGARVFLEVGPKRAQAGFVKDILQSRPHRAMPLTHPKIGELEQLGRTVATLVVDGVVPYGRKRIADTIEVRAPFVGTAQASAQTQQAQAEQRAQQERVAQLESALAQALAQLAQAPQAGAAAPSGNGLDMVASDPGFWQFLGLQGPALLRSLMASYQAARALQGQPHGFPWASVPASWGGAPAGVVAPNLAPNLAPNVAPVAVPAVAPVVPAAPVVAPSAPAAFTPPATAEQSALLGGTLFSRGAPVEHTDSTPSKSNGNGHHAPAPSAPTPETDLAGWVLGRVAEITGYQVEELDLDAHLEAELGIDSIRQIEIILGLRDELKLPKDDNFKVSDYPNLRSLIDYLEKRSGKSSSKGQGASASF